MTRPTDPFNHGACIKCGTPTMHKAQICGSYACLNRKCRGCGQVFTPRDRISLECLTCKRRRVRKSKVMGE